jgi:hypothetical protein
LENYFDVEAASFERLIKPIHEPEGGLHGGRLARGVGKTSEVEANLLKQDIGVFAFQ